MNLHRWSCIDREENSMNEWEAQRWRLSAHHKFSLPKSWKKETRKMLRTFSQIIKDDKESTEIAARRMDFSLFFPLTAGWLVGTIRIFGCVVSKKIQWTRRRKYVLKFCIIFRILRKNKTIFVVLNNKIQKLNVNVVDFSCISSWK